MKKWLLILLPLLVITAWLFNFPRSSEQISAQVATTIFPLYDITTNIAGDLLNIKLILPPGASPHTFEPKPADVISLQYVQVVYAVGYGLDDWIDTLVESTGAEKKVVDSGIDLRQYSELLGNRESELDGEAETIDPHYWLSIPNAKLIAQNITDDLSNRFPEYKNDFSQNLQEYLIKLEAADAEIRIILSHDVENISLITMHDAWYYFCGEYNLFLVGSFEPTAGREPTPSYLASIIDLSRTSRVSIIYSEPQLSLEMLRTFLSDNNLSTAILDPIGGVPERMSYIDLMLYNAQTIAYNQ